MEGGIRAGYFTCERRLREERGDRERTKKAPPKKNIARNGINIQSGIYSDVLVENKSNIRSINNRWEQYTKRHFSNTPTQIEK